MGFTKTFDDWGDFYGLRTVIQEFSDGLTLDSSEVILGVSEMIMSDATVPVYMIARRKKDEITRLESKLAELKKQATNSIQELKVMKQKIIHAENDRNYAEENAKNLKNILLREQSENKSLKKENEEIKAQLEAIKVYIGKHKFDQIVEEVRDEFPKKQVHPPVEDLLNVNLEETFPPDDVDKTTEFLTVFRPPIH